MIEKNEISFIYIRNKRTLKLKNICEIKGKYEKVFSNKIKKERKKFF